MLQVNVNRNANLLVNRFFKNTKYIDLHFEGNVNKISLERTDALINEIKMWLLSSADDYYGFAGFGGPLDPFIGKPLNEENVSALSNSIQIKFTRFFTNITLNYINVSINQGTKSYKIEMVFEDKINKKINAISESIEI